MRNQAILLDKNGNEYIKPIEGARNPGGNIVDLSSFRRAVGLDMNPRARHKLVDELNKLKHVFNDSVGSIFFLRQLEYIKAQIFEVKYEDLPARELFPVSNEAGTGKKTITYRVYDKVGQAILIGNMADDLPRADVFAKEVSINIKWLGTSYGYSIGDMQASSVAGGMPLDQRRAEAAFRGMEQAVNQIAIFGTSDASALPGLYNNQYIPRSTVADGASMSTLWSSKTPEEIIADVTAFANSIVSNTLMIERPNTLLLPPAQYYYIASTNINTANASNVTILKYITTTSPFFKGDDSVRPINEAVGAATFIGGFSGNDSNDVMIAYNRDPMKMQLEIPVEFTSQPLQERNLEFVVPCWMNIAGLNVYFPQSASFAAGI